VTAAEPATPVRQRRSHRGRTWLKVVVVIAVALALLAVGIAIGMALEERPVPGGMQTLVRTLEPLPQTTP
jgi:hypothetical protein